MPQRPVDKNHARRLKQERDQRYQQNPEVRDKKKERDRLYQQRKREQTRLQQHNDPLARLGDCMTQQEYLEGADLYDELLPILPIDEEIATDVCGVLEEDGEVLQSCVGCHGSENINEDDVAVDGELNDDGNECTYFTYDRRVNKGGGRKQPGGGITNVYRLDIGV